MFKNVISSETFSRVEVVEDFFRIMARTTIPPKCNTIRDDVRMLMVRFDLKKIDLHVGILIVLNQGLIKELIDSARKNIIQSCLEMMRSAGIIADLDSTEHAAFNDLKLLINLKTRICGNYDLYRLDSNYFKDDV